MNKNDLIEKLKDLDTRMAWYYKMVDQGKLDNYKGKWIALLLNKEEPIYSSSEQSDVLIVVSALEQEFCCFLPIVIMRV